MKSVYVLIREDRHSDIGIEIFEDAQAAIAEAKKTALEFAAYNNQLNINESSCPGCLWQGVYSSEGDYVAVLVRDIKEKS